MISRTFEKKMELLNPWLKQEEAPTTKKKKNKQFNKQTVIVKN